ncbi:MAG: glycosyltransferase family 39 protein [Bryobacteraceae bacterium]|jgi:4-amino-4-deoxy-L-arabinose transferase-like glycosyltransferase
MTPSIRNQVQAFHLNPRLRFLLLALAAAILFLGAIRLGDLAGYDDAMYSLEAKGIVRTGDWLTPRSRGGPALEHPPLFVWTQAAFLSVFGISDPVAKAPSALCGLGAVLLAYWLTRRLLDDKLAASVAMFVALATPYFIKYAGRAMTDVPAAFLFVCAVCAWSLAEDDPRWYLAAGAFTAMASMVRGLIGFALPLVFALHLIAVRRRPAWRYLIPSLMVAIAPLAAWDGYLLLRYRGYFVNLHQGWLQREVYGPLTPAWRRCTGAFEYAWMLAKSYWPWLPAMLAGLVAVIRQRRRPLYLLLCWAGAVFLLCAMSRSRVLRYMLPAYPALAILSAIGLLKCIPRRIIERAMDWAPPLAVAAAVLIVLLFPPHWHATEIRAIAQAQSRVLPPGELVGFYDKGDPRYDETNQLEWYGNGVPLILPTRADLEEALRAGSVRVFVLDNLTYRERIEALPHDVIVRSERLIGVRLKPR